MAKQIQLYILLLSGILSACQSDFVNEISNSDSQGELLSLSVSACDIVAFDREETRATDAGASTIFDSGDRVGLIVTDNKGNILVNNAPFVLNDGQWNFDTENTENKTLPYFDATMSRYIVYYPYDSSADGCKTLDNIHKLDVFVHRENQTKKEDFIKSDLMAWTSEGTNLIHINAQLKHLRNSLSINPKIKWTLTTGESIIYQPLKESLEGYYICDKDNNKLSVYHASDSTYRYILPDGYEGKLSWGYRYRGEYFNEERIVPAQVSGIRFNEETIADMGVFDNDWWVLTDLYCSKEINNVNTGYVIPWDAMTLLKTHRCIGILSYLGHHKKDMSHYPPSRIIDNNVSGYVMALTDVMWGEDNEPMTLQWAAKSNLQFGYIAPDYDFSGYDFTQSIITDTIKGKGCTAAELCANYGRNQGWQKDLIAPDNSSGWFLPVAHQFVELYNIKQTVIYRIRQIAQHCGYEYADKIELQHFGTAKPLEYWGSNLYIMPQTICPFFFKWNNGLTEPLGMALLKRVRAFLAF